MAMVLLAGPELILVTNKPGEDARVRFKAEITGAALDRYGTTELYGYASALTANGSKSDGVLIRLLEPPIPEDLRIVIPDSLNDNPNNTTSSSASFFIDILANFTSQVLVIVTLAIGSFILAWCKSKKFQSRVEAVLERFRKTNKDKNAM